ncbi:MAG: aminotransferase class III-fold pyridoxal phosphate-dependent enzyme [Gammaproteobacteria bacterium]|jgi:glutamate-1-semialdehyde aminotransferase/spore coat polysaccharide biosynthesis protein SpsF (cytidylyltransferase family)|nr:aminotransferase class III-fold pyridoxal phosphate-dependent enzyme [Gammaproteobacteria bacterium]MBT6074960.1 aminotransferase class III-fold pyridoxal phosphate-dependent enzyme [Gammaproteobacteria bacterium]MBT7753419.1 aminotransferase class III-fold pyridoxal phosphate-dependent enzyme [Gammaproteobacteria bacterium]
MKKNITAIIQARLGSKRFPGKVLKKLSNKSLIEILFTRLKESQHLSNIVFAIPDNDENIDLEKEIESIHAAYFSGDEDDVLKRYYMTAKKFNAEHIVRITADCPLIDPMMLDEMLLIYSENNFDYMSNTNPPSYPDGFDIEIFSYEALDDAYKNAIDDYDREHVTPYIHRNSDNIIYNYQSDIDFSGLRLTVDDPEDLELLEAIAKQTPDIIDVSYEEILSIFKNKPELKKVNNNSIRNEGATMGTGQKLYRRAKKIIPGGTMLLSKRPENFLPELWPSYFSKAKGCSVWDLDANKYIDMSIMGIGTNILGYANDKIDSQVIDAIKNSVASTLNCPEEVELAERLIDINPWSDMVRLARTGGEINAVSIRIARAATGRDKVALCGYHGWHDWYLSTNLNSKEALSDLLLPGLEPKGVPKALEGTTIPFAYNDIQSLKKIFDENKGQIAAIKMEVSRNDPPKDNFLKNVRDLATKNDCVLIFDECTSGFRETFGGLHQKYDVEPDLALYSKALGNGYAISALVGRASIMESAQSTFISSTFWTERVGPTAALATLREMENIQSWKIITEMGYYIRERWQELADSTNLDIKIWGLPALSGFSFNSKNDNLYKTLITQEMIDKNILAANSIYVSTAHTKKVVDHYLDQLSLVFEKIALIESDKININDCLNSKEAFTGFKRLN